MKKQIILTAIVVIVIFTVGAGGCLLAINKKEQRSYRSEESKTVAQEPMSFSKKESSEKSKSQYFNVKEEQAKTAVLEELEKTKKCNRKDCTVDLKAKICYIEGNKVRAYKAVATTVDGKRYECKVNGNNAKITDLVEYTVDKQNDKIAKRQEENGVVVKKINDNNAKPFDKIVYDNKLGTELVIKKGSSYSVEAELKGRSYSVSYEIKDRVLHIDIDTDALIRNEVPDHLNYVTVTVPKSILSDIEVNGAVGDVELEKISANHANIILGCGDVKISNCKIGDCKATPHCGSVEVEKWQNGNLNVECNVGSVEVQCAGARKDYSCNVVSNIGDSNVSGSNEAGAKYSIDITNQCGSADVQFEK